MLIAYRSNKNTNARQLRQFAFVTQSMHIQFIYNFGLMLYAYTAFLVLFACIFAVFCLHIAICKQMWQAIQNCLFLTCYALQMVCKFCTMFFCSIAILHCIRYHVMMFCIVYFLLCFLHDAAVFCSTTNTDLLQRQLTLVDTKLPEIYTQIQNLQNEIGNLEKKLQNAETGYKNTEQICRLAKADEKSYEKRYNEMKYAKAANNGMQHRHAKNTTKDALLQKYMMYKKARQDTEVVLDDHKKIIMDIRSDIQECKKHIERAKTAGMDMQYKKNMLMDKISQAKKNKKWS